MTRHMNPRLLRIFTERREKRGKGSIYWFDRKWTLENVPARFVLYRALIRFYCAYEVANQTLLLSELACLFSDFGIVLSEIFRISAHELFPVPVVSCQVQHSAIVMHTPWMALEGNHDFMPMEQKSKGLVSIIKIPAGEGFCVPWVIRGGNHHKAVYQRRRLIAIL